MYVFFMQRWTHPHPSDGTGCRAISFFAYGNGKRIFTDLNGGYETSLVHMAAAITAGEYAFISIAVTSIGPLISFL
jgi:hypothetical protein